MAATSRFSFGDVVLVPFAFTDQSRTKKRPAVIVSSSSYNAGRRDIVIMAITSQVRTPLGFGEAMAGDEDPLAGPETAADHHAFQGALPLAQSSSRWFLSRSVSIGCQKPR